VIVQNHISEEIGDGKALRDLGYQNAKARLEEHRDKVIALAERLIEDGQINEAEVQQLMA
jgi:ATP-dependent Zn protease